MFNDIDVLIACEYSATVRDEFRAQGFNAVSCDLLPTDVPGPHYQGDVFEYLEGLELLGIRVKCLIAHPPCTYLTNSGVVWLHRDPSRWEKMRDGAEFFKRLLALPIPMKAIENPIMHRHAREIVGKDKSQVVQPWMFGHTEQKATCLWLENLPLLKPTKDVKTEMMALPKRERERLHYLPPSPDRWKLRSTTYRGIAKAMASQWGELLKKEAKNG